MSDFTTREPNRNYRSAKRERVNTTNAANEKVGGLQHRTEYHSVGEIRPNVAFDQIRTAADGVTTNASTTVTSATAKFDANDVSAKITGTNIPANATITSVTNATTVVISAAATASGTAITLTISRTAVRYVALKPMKVNGVMVYPGAIVPEANGWRNLHNYLSTGHLAAIGS